MTQQQTIYNHAPNYGPQGVFQGAVTTNVNVTEGGTYLQRVQQRPAIERHAQVPRPPRALRSFHNREQELALLRAELRPDGVAWLTGWYGAGRSTLLYQVANDPQARTLHDGRLYLDGRFQALHLDDVLQRLFERFYTSKTTVRVTPDIARAQLADVEALLLLDSLPLSAHDLYTLTNDLRPNAVFLTADGPAPETIPETSLWGLPRLAARKVLLHHARLKSAPPAAVVDALCAALADTPLPLVLAGKLLREGQIAPTRLASLLQTTLPEAPPSRALERLMRVLLGVLDKPALTVLGVLTRAAHPVADLRMISEVGDLPAATADVAVRRVMNLGLVRGGNDRYQTVSRSVQTTLDLVLSPGKEQEHAAGYLLAALPAYEHTPSWLLFQRDNLLAAAETLLSKGYATQAATMARAVHSTIVQQGHWGAWQQIVALGSKAARLNGDTALQAWALHEQGTRAGLLGDFQVASNSLREAERLRRALGDEAGSALSHHNLTYLEALAPSLQAHPPNRLVTVGGTSIIAMLAVALLWFLMGRERGSATPMATPAETSAAVVAQLTETPTATSSPSSPPLPPTSTPVPFPPTATPRLPTAITEPPTATFPPPTPLPIATPTPPSTPTPTPRQPDLIVESISGPDSATVGAELGKNVVFIIKNIGTTNAIATNGYFHTDLVLSTDELIGNADDTLLRGGRDQVKQVLAPGQSLKVSLAVSNIPDDTAPGTYYLGAIVDSVDNHIEETNEKNNTAFYYPLKVVEIEIG